MKKATNEQLLESYSRLGNVWKVAAEFDMCGQSVWERLRKLGIEDKDKWSNEQLQSLVEAYSNALNGPVNLDSISQSIGKLKSNISRKARELGLTSRHRGKSPEDKVKLQKGLENYIREKGYPRGYREIRICPVCNKFFEVPHSSKKRFCSYSCANKERMKGMNVFSRSKSGKREDLGRQFFRSNYEANYARYLNFVIALGGDIKRWEFEPDTFEFKKIKRGTRFYTPDFKVFFKDDRIEYHEVKGWDYPKGITQRKRFAKYYPHLKLLLVDGEFFKELKRRGFDKVIPNWE